MNSRLVVCLVLPLLAVVVAGTAGCGRAEDPPVAVPSFSSEKRADQAAAKVRTTLLPTDCNEVLAGAVGMSALLGQPVDSVQTKSVVGVSAPAVGRLEKVTCQYRRSSTKSGPVDVTLSLYAYTDARAAAQHIRTNVRAEQGTATSSQDLHIGVAPAVYLEQPDQALLFVTNGRSAVTVAMRRGVMPADQTRPIMVDLAQRVLPNLVPEPAAEPRRASHSEPAARGAGTVSVQGRTGRASG